ncbi:1-phosphatidylinositol-3-phosphate 5-kinase [Chytriomyces hyalinus]|nr:1-phosphatidylinositol-3-phosphate 5-kinase [Chytriomyces hyalinus]
MPQPPFEQVNAMHLVDARITAKGVQGLTRPLASDRWPQYNEPDALNLSLDGLLWHRSHEYLTALTRQLLVGNADASEWVPVIVDLATRAVAHHLRPSQPLSMQQSQYMGINAFLKLKKVPGGSPSLSHYVDGIVFTKRMAHKSMIAPIDQPRILLIAFPLEFVSSSSTAQRPSTTATSFSSFDYMSLDTILSQEREYLSLLVARIAALRPSLIFASSNVSRVALEMFVAARISVAANVKTETLSSIARCCHAAIVTSLDQLVDSAIGCACARFSVKTFDDPLIEGIRKSFVFLEGCGITPSGEYNETSAGDEVNKLMLQESLLESSTYRNLPSDSVSRVAENRIGGRDSKPSIPTSMQSFAASLSPFLPSAASFSANPQKTIQAKNLQPSSAVPSRNSSSSSTSSMSPVFKRFPTPNGSAAPATSNPDRMAEEMVAAAKTVQKTSYGSSTHHSAASKIGNRDGGGRIGTVILRGGSLEQLQFIKTVMDLIAFVAYNIVLEQSFLLDEGVQLQNIGLDGEQLFREPNSANTQARIDTAAVGAESTPNLKTPESKKHSAFPAEDDLKGEGGELARGIDSRNIGLEIEIPEKVATAAGSMTPVKKQIPSPVAKSPSATVIASSAKIGSGSDAISTLSLRQNEKLATTQLGLLLQKYESLLLSASPGVKFPPPHILSRLAEIKMNSGTFSSSTTAYTGSNASNSSSSSSNITFSKSRINSSTDQMVASLESNSSIYFEKSNELTPFLSQRIMFLFSNINIETMIPCHPAELHIIEYYSETDISVGMYIQELCANYSAPCPSKNCGQPMVRHFRSYTHGDGRIHVVLEELHVASQEEIVTWSFCKHCHVKTPHVKMSPLARQYSFGKYLELMYYMETKGRGASVGLGDSARSECMHDVHREHVRFFAYKRFVVRFEFEKISLLEVSVPAMHVQSSVDVSLRLKTQDYEARRTQIVKFYESVAARIKHFGNEVIPQETTAALFSEFTQNLSKRAVTEKKMMLQNLQHSFSQSSDSDSLALNSVLHSIYENVGKWESDFSVLAKSFFTTDITKERGVRGSGPMTQLKGLFSDLNSNLTFSTEELKDRSVAVAAALIQLGGSPTRSTPEVQLEPSLVERRSDADAMRKLLKDSDVFDLTRLVTDSQVEELEDSQQIRPASAMDLLRNEPDDVLDIPVSPSFSMAARWRLEFIDDDEESTNGSGENLAGSSSMGSSSIVRHDSGKSETNTAVVPGSAAARVSRLSILTGERASILQTLSALWSGSLGSLPPLEYPLVSSEHLFHDSLVIVREDEPSSIIAFTLSSSKYRSKLKQFQQGNVPPPPDAGNDAAKEETMPSQTDSAAAGDSGNADIEEKLTSGKGYHIKFEFWDGPTKLDCKAFFAEQFDALRRNCGFEEGYLHSLSRCNRWDALGGKSGSAFMKTRDDRLILKQLSRQEMEALLKFAPFYFTYLSEAFFHQLPTVLAKIFGFYRIGYKNPTTNKYLKMDVLVMENLFYERTISRIFDLKGSMRNRHVQSTGKQNQVLLDENLLEFLSESPLFIREYSKRILRASVWNDTLFLSKMDVMDYSLLVGIDEERKELVVGIVDYMRTFTWDKKLESWVKETGILGGGTVQPTILSPRQYKNRFRESMEKYFLMVTSFLERVE